MNASEFEVAVVGTGVAGLAAALGCAQSGLKVALIGPAPREPAAGIDSRIYALAPTSTGLLERLGVWRETDSSRTAAIERMRVFGDSGNELTFDAYSAAVPRLATIVEEAELLRVLATACRYQPGIASIAAPFAQMVPAAAGHDVQLVDGGHFQAALVVGADGAQSAVRAAAGINVDERPYRERGVVGNFGCDKPHLNTAWQWFTDEGVVALLPLPGNAVSLVWSAPDAIAEALLALPPEQLADRVTARTHSAVGRLTALGPTFAFPLRRLSVDRPIGPGVALVGDAAHVVHPLAGQGLNLGLQDVAVLLDVLANRSRHQSLGDLSMLRRYQRRRAEDVALMRWTTDSLQRLFMTEAPLARTVRNAGLTVVDRLIPLKNLLIRRALG